jgi:hypothetical protein
MHQFDLSHGCTGEPVMFYILSLEKNKLDVLVTEELIRE